MQVERLAVTVDGAMPLIAVFPYRVSIDDPDDARIVYDPTTQLTRFAGRDFSTCREDESVVRIFSSKSDTKKDD